MSPDYIPACTLASIKIHQTLFFRGGRRETKTINIIHGTGLETNHVRQLVVYILYSAMCVWDYFIYSAISQEN